jgi:hypothetical protein
MQHMHHRRTMRASPTMTFDGKGAKKHENLIEKMKMNRKLYEWKLEKKKRSRKLIR